MHRNLVRPAVAACAGALLLLAAGGTADAASSRFAARFDAGQPARLAWDRVPGLDKLTSTGAAPAGRVMHVEVAFRDPDTRDELAALHAMYTPGSPTFHHFLTPSQIGQRWGTDPRAVADVEHRLTAAGMSVDVVAATGDMIAAHGTVADVERAFDVTEQSYRYNGIDFVANTAGPMVMSGDQVGTVIGLDTLARFHVPSHAVRPHRSSASDPLAFDDSSPQALWSVYGMPGSLQFSGAGQRLAVIGDGDTTLAVEDLRGFEDNFGLPHIPVDVHCPEQNSCGPDDSGGDGEWDIDFQASTSMAPNADALEPYFAQSIADADLNYAFLGWIQDASAPRQASASLGECEQTPLNGIWTGPLEPYDGNNGGSFPGGVASLGAGDDEQAALDTQLMHAAEQGKTLFASTGDAGAFCNAVYPPTNLNGVVYGGDPSPEYPASSAFSVAVGGTVLFTNDGLPGPTGSATTGSISRTAEYAWEFSGGGNSNFEAAGFYQTDNGHAYTKLAVPCLSSPDQNPPSAGTGVQCRGLPDVAAQSGDVFTLNGFDIYNGSGSSSAGMCNGCGGGTSLSAPLWNGMWTRIQSSNPDPAGYGYANALLYALGEDSTTDARDFYDITTGANGLYTALPGWDNVSGFGTPNVGNIIADAPTVTPLTDPAVAVPEAPAPGMLLLVALGAGGGVYATRRRRKIAAEGRVSSR